MLHKIKNMKSSISFVKNSYSVGIIVVVIGIAIIFNLILQQATGTSLQVDISETNLYEISDITVGVLEELESEVTFTILAQKEYTDDIIINFIDRYTALSDKITVEWIDPVLYPSALETYNTSYETIVISCESTGKSNIVAFSDILYFNEYSYYYEGVSETEFDGDGLFTSAVSQVTSDKSYKLYTVSGHGELSFSDEISALMTKNSVTVETLDLLTATEIPEDCELLVMNSPITDITEDEQILLLDYMAAGGDTMLLLGSTADVDTPNIAALMEAYGLVLADGYIADLERAYQGNAYYIIPNVYVTDEMANDMQTGSVLIVNSQGFTEGTLPSDTMSVSTFMETSSSGVAVSTTEEITGTYMLGAVVTEPISMDDEYDILETRFTVYGTSNMIESGITSAFTSLENTTLFMNSVMANFDGASNVSIPTKVIEETYNLVESSQGYTLLLVIMIPLFVLVSGFMVWFGRRKR